MAYERVWPAVSQNFTANGTQDGIVTVADTAGFYVKQAINLTSTAFVDPLPLEVKRIDGTTIIHVGPIGTSMLSSATNISTYLVADSAKITANEQLIRFIKPDEIRNFIYEREPIKADRVIFVDKYGRYYDSVVDINGLNRLAVDANVVVTIPPVSIDIDALTPPTQANPDNILIVGSDDATKTGFKRALKSKPDGSLNVVDFLDAGTGVEGFITVGTSAIEAKVGGSPLAGRRSLTVYNGGTALLYWGYTPGVTIASGTPIFKKQQAVWTVGPNQSVYLISSVAGNNIRVTEGA